MIIDLANISWRIIVVISITWNAHHSYSKPLPYNIRDQGAMRPRISRDGAIIKTPSPLSTQRGTFARNRMLLHYAIYGGSNGYLIGACKEYLPPKSRRLGAQQRCCPTGNDAGATRCRERPLGLFALWHLWLHVWNIALWQDLISGSARSASFFVEEIRGIAYMPLRARCRIRLAWCTHGHHKHLHIFALFPCRLIGAPSWLYHDTNPVRIESSMSTLFESAG